jgi:uncharacterized protein CbrC (UPF0167 family)
VYSEEDGLDDKLCPWCIADGSAHQKFDAVFIDSDGFGEGMPRPAMEEIERRTPGYNSFQSEVWPVCCNDAVEFIMPAGITEVRKYDYTLEGQIMGDIVHGMQISGSAATRLLQSLNKDTGPSVYIFRCPRCDRHHFHIDQS